MRIRIPRTKYIRIDIHTMVDMEARMDFILVRTKVGGHYHRHHPDITTEDIQDGIVEGIGGGVDSEQ